MTSHRPLLGSGLLAVALAGCAVDSPAPVAHDSAVIMDQLHNGGTEGFLLLPPMVPRPAQLGDVVPALPVKVEVDEVDQNGTTKRHIATFSTDAEKPKERIRFREADAALGPEDDGDTDPVGFYVARWKTNDYDLSESATYRVRIRVPASKGGVRELGFADVDVVKNQKQFKNVDATNFTPLINGEILRIKFRVDRPAVDQDGDGFFDWADNCPSIANDQADSLGNGIGDVCRCDALPADFGGITCDASVTCLGDLSHLEVGCSQGEVDPSLAATLHTSTLSVQCGAVGFKVDPALGDGTFKAESKVGDKTYTLSYTQKSGTTGTKPRRKWFSVEVARLDLMNQGLGECRITGAATVTEGPGLIENGRLLDVGARYPIVAFDNVLLSDKTGLCQAQSLDKGGAISTQCGDTADFGRSQARLPTLCTAFGEGGPKRNSFVDLHTTAATARESTVASFGGLGGLAAGTCPNAGSERNLEEAFRLPPLAKGATSVTLHLDLRGTEAEKAALGDIVFDLSSAKDPSTPVVSLRVAAWPASGDLVVAIPAERLNDFQSLSQIAHALFDKKKDPPPPPPPNTDGMDKVELSLDVEAK